MSISDLLFYLQKIDILIIYHTIIQQSQGGIVMIEVKKGKPEILKFIQIKTGYIVMMYRLSGVLHFRKVGYIRPLELGAQLIEKEFGQDEAYNEEKMIKDLHQLLVSYKLFDEFIIQPKAGRIIGIYRDSEQGQTIFRVIGFTDPLGLRDRYKEMLAKEGKSEVKPYWKAFGLGDEWVGTNINREMNLFTLIIPNAKSETFEVKAIF
jgi:hypothetical protein